MPSMALMSSWPSQSMEIVMSQRLFCLHQARQHGVLVAAVAALADADIVLITGRQLVDDLPGAVL